MKKGSRKYSHIKTLPSGVIVIFVLPPVQPIHDSYLDDVPAHVRVPYFGFKRVLLESIVPYFPCEGYVEAVGWLSVDDNVYD